jgi:chromosome segregation ATPase
MTLSYYMREESQPRRRWLEMGAAVAAAIILTICMVSSVPYVNETTRGARIAKEREQDRQAMAQLQVVTRQLQARNQAAETQLAHVARLLESTRSDVSTLTEGHGTLRTQVATTTAKVQQLDTVVQQTSEELAKISGTDIVRKITKERDDAILRSQNSDGRVRDLTLKLQRAGIYP